MINAMAASQTIYAMPAAHGPYSMEAIGYPQYVQQVSHPKGQTNVPFALLFAIWSVATSIHRSDGFPPLIAI